jgi:hypothetical protein
LLIGGQVVGLRVQNAGHTPGPGGLQKSRRLSPVTSRERAAASIAVVNRASPFSMTFVIPRNTGRSLSHLLLVERFLTSHNVPIWGRCH